MALGSRRGHCRLLVLHQVTSQHPVTLYGFILALFTLAAMVALTVTGDVDSSVSVPVIVGLGASGIGAGAGIAQANKAATDEGTTGTVGYTDPNA